MKTILQCSGHKLILPNIVSAKGLYVLDSEGHQFMDLESGVWSTSLGHSHTRINNVIKKQINNITHSGFCYSSKIVEKSASSILAITELTEGKCVFLSSGSEAIEIIRQATLHLNANSKTLVLSGAELGMFGSVTNRQQGWYNFEWKNCNECTDDFICELHQQSIKEIPSDITEFIFEPGSCAGLVCFPPKALIQKIAKKVHSNGGVVVSNEVTTGIGRTGKWFGYQHYDLKPDIIAIGKGIGNGYPVSVAVFSKSISKTLTSFKYNQSHQNDPLGAAVVSEVIDTIKDEGLIQEAERKGNQLLSMLKKLEGSGIKIRGKGLMFAIEFNNKEIANRVYNALIEKGFIVCNRGSFLRIDPPLIITIEEIGQFLEALFIAVEKHTASSKESLPTPRPPRPLRTVRESFPSYGSSLSKEKSIYNFPQ